VGREREGEGETCGFDGVYGRSKGKGKVKEGKKTETIIGAGC
jgi:hypothetical protein